MSASTAGAPSQPAAAHTVTVNDQPRPFIAGTTLAVIAAELGVSDRKGVAIAVNGAVVARSTWPDHRLAAGDRVLVIRATQGG